MIIHPPENFLLISLATILIIGSEPLAFNINSLFSYSFKGKDTSKNRSRNGLGGLKGRTFTCNGDSSLSSTMNRDLFIYLTYIVVIFTIVIQGLTLKKVVSKSIRLINNSRKYYGQKILSSNFETKVNPDIVIVVF